MTWYRGAQQADRTDTRLRRVQFIRHALGALQGGLVSDDPIRRSATEFTTVARRFITLIDGRHDVPVEDFLLAGYPLLCELTFRASMLPDVWSDHDSPEDRMSHAEWRRLYDSLTDYLGPYNLFWGVHDPIALKEDDPITGTLADGLADIYRDLCPGLQAVAERRGRIPYFVIWQWRFDFYSHWGHHAIDVMRAIHARISQHGLGEDDDDDESAEESA